MAQSSPAAGQSLAASLQPLLRARKPVLSVGEMIGRIESGDGPGPILFVLTVPVLMPLPPGVSMLLALPLLIVAPQILAGRRKLWIPAALSRRTIKREDLVKLLHRVLPTLKRCESLARPRLRFLTGWLGARLVGLACTVIAIVLVLPIPFANFLPALAMTLLAIGLSRRDGLMVLAGYGLIIAAGVVIALGVHGASLGLTRLRAMI